MQEIIDCLQKRNVLLNPPLSLSSRDWNEIAHHYFKHSQHIAEGYGWFDGFGEDTYDDNSMMSLWPASKINKRRAHELENELAIGDFLIDSDLIIVDVDGQIRLKFENRLLAKSLFDFLHDLCQGHFDIQQSGAR
jgi:hypothetical protein